MKSFFSYRIFVAAAVLLAVAVSLIGIRWRSAQPTGELRIGYAIEAPYAFLGPNGRVTGESPETARWIANALGIEHLQWVQTTFDALLSDLELNRFDVVAAGMFITAERARRVTFSRPSFHAKQAMLVRNGNPHGLHSYVDAVRMQNIRVAVIAGSVEEQLLMRLGLPRARLIAVPDALTGQATVATGLAAALALSSPSIRWMTARAGPTEIEMAMPFDQTEDTERPRLGYGAFAFRPADRDLIRRWNEVMRHFIGGAEHLAVVSPFGFTREEIESLPSPESILAK